MFLNNNILADNHQFTREPSYLQNLFSSVRLI